MEQRFKLTIEVAFGEESQDKILALARAKYERGGVVPTRGENGRPRRLKPTEFIGSVQQALAELAERNLFFRRPECASTGWSVGQPHRPTSLKRRRGSTSTTMI